MLLPRLKKHTYLVAAILRYSNSQNKRQPIVFMIQCSILNIVTLYYAVLNCDFVTIATILGTGVLGLPVTLSQCGLHPFLISFFVCYLVQVLLIYFFTDLLQKACASQARGFKIQAGEENVPLRDMNSEDESEGETEAEMINTLIRAPNLHSLGEMFLNNKLAILFDFILIIQFVALLISYSLAGSQAFTELLNIGTNYTVPTFVCFLTLCIVFALNFIQPVVALLTMAKASLLLGTVVVTFFVGSSINHKVTNNYSFIGESFLMGTVALGGIVNVMPMLYGKIESTASQIKGLRSSIIAGLTTCTLLNVLWCYAVLEIVPQENTCFIADNHHTICNLSLQTSRINGEISTVPLTQMIHHMYPKYDWVAMLVEIFIVISISVSYLTIGAAMHHTLSGWIEHLWRIFRSSDFVEKHQTFCQKFFTEMFARKLLSLLMFSLIFTIAMMNPKGFESMLEKIASLFINLEAGLFIYLMILRSASPEFRNLRIKVPLPAWITFFKFLIPIYFLFAVFYDGLASFYEIVLSDNILPWEHENKPIASLYTLAPPLLTTIEDNSTFFSEV